VVEKQGSHTWLISGFENTDQYLREQLQLGDRLIKVDDQEPASDPSIQKWRNIDKAQSITISRDGKEHVISIHSVQSGTNPNMVTLLGEIVSILLAVILYLKSRSSLSAVWLSLVFLTIAAIFMSLGASSRGDALGKLLINTSLMALPIVFMHFLVVFFREKGQLHLPFKFLYFFYGVVLLALVSKLTYFIPGAAYLVYSSTNSLTILFFLVGLLLNFVMLSIVYFKYRKQSAYLSTVIKTILFSLSVSFLPFVCFSLVPLLLYNNGFIEPLYTGCIMLFFPISFAYLIISKQLYDIDTLLRRMLFTSIISIIPSITIVFIVSFVFDVHVSIVKMIVSFIVVLVTFSFFLYSLEYFTSKFEPFVFPRKHQLQNGLRKISKNLGSISSFRELKEIILVDIVQTLSVYGGAVVFRYPHQMEIISEGDIDAIEVEKLIDIGWFEDHPVYTCFEVNKHEEYTSYLVMTRKRTNTMLGLEDRQWLGLIISYLAVSLENIYLIRKLTMKMQELASQLPNEEAGKDFVWFRKLMFELQEKERVRIATDLHDTTMQDLFFLKKRFASIMDKLALEKKQEEQFSSIIEFVEIINTNLRQSCFDLHPHLLQEIGLVQTVNKLVERESYESSFQIHFSGERAYSIEHKDLETKRHLFRMVQELITNAKKHSEASIVNIILIAYKDFFSLTYEDNGIGFDEGRLVTREIGATGIGMEQLKSRTLLLNGQFDLQTAKGKGVKINITIPLREGLTA
jgi:two-component system sensor histidine kinase ComP